jgi:hypothetical protein
MADGASSATAALDPKRTGDEEFRRVMGWELLASGVEVVDCPLPPDEQDKIRSER